MYIVYMHTYEYTYIMYKQGGSRQLEVKCSMHECTEQYTHTHTHNRDEGLCSCNFKFHAFQRSSDSSKC